MAHEIRGVDVEKYAYYVNKFRQNVGLETWLWRQILTAQTVHTKYKWPPYATEWKIPMKIFCVRHWNNLIFIIRFNQINGMCYRDLLFYIACVHRDINMSLNKTDSCI